MTKSQWRQIVRHTTMERMARPQNLRPTPQKCFGLPLPEVWDAREMTTSERADWLIYKYAPELRAVSA